MADGQPKIRSQAQASTEAANPSRVGVTGEGVAKIEGLLRKASGWPRRRGLPSGGIDRSSPHVEAEQPGEVYPIFVLSIKKSDR